EAFVISDEVHAPLTLRGSEFTPYLSVSEEAREHGITAASGSKAFNLAGLKTALFVADSDRMGELLESLPEEVSLRTGLFGHIATRVGFTSARRWLAQTITTVESNFALLERRLTEKLPEVRLRRPGATYLAWLDMSALGWGDDPAQYATEHARVALSSGPSFGAQGAGHARMNVACAPETIVEAVDRLSAAVGAGTGRPHPERRAATHKVERHESWHRRTRSDAPLTQNPFLSPSELPYELPDFSAIREE